MAAMVLIGAVMGAMMAVMVSMLYPMPVIKIV
jgi:hypothetical protein